MFPEKSSDYINFISVKAAAEKTGYTTDYLSRLAKNGKIYATKTEDGWMVDERSVHAFVAESEEKRKARARALSEERKREYKFSGSTSLATYSAVKINVPSKNGLEIKSAVGTTNRISDAGNGGREKFQAAAFSIGAALMLVAVATAPHLLTNHREFSTQGAVVQAADENPLEAVAVAWYRFVHSTTRAVASLFFEPGDRVLVREDSSSLELPLADPIPAAAGNAERMVVVPVPEGVDPVQQARQIRNSFSDEVTVEPLDESSGIITPVFKSRAEDQYLYVMVPAPPGTQ